MTILLFDDFNRADNALTPNPPSDGLAVWQPGTTATPTIYGISGHRLYPADPEDGGPTWRDCGTPNHGIEITVFYGVFVTVRNSNDVDFITWWVDNTFNGGIYRRDVSFFDRIATFPATPVDGDILRMECIGDVINCYQNGAFKGTVTTTFNNTATGAGIIVEAGGFADDCTIYSTAAPPSPSAAVPFRRFQGYARA
jgi:hypothetical protein